MNIKADESHFGLWRVSIFTIRRLITFYYRPYDEHFSARVKLAFLFSIFSKLLLYPQPTDWNRILYYIFWPRKITIQYLKYQRWILQNYIHIHVSIISFLVHSFHDSFIRPIHDLFYFLRTAINANRSIRARRHLHVVVDVITFFTMSRSVAYAQRSRDQTSARSFVSLRVVYPQSSIASGIIISIFPGGTRFEANETKRNESEGTTAITATMLTTTRWWPVVNETTESKINKIKGKEIGSGHRTRGTTRPRDPIRPDSNAYPIRLNENNNSSLIIISYLSIDRSISTFHSLAPSIAIPSTISTATGFKSNSTTATVLLLSHGPHRETGSPETCWWGGGNEIRSPKRDLQTRLIPITTILDPPLSNIFRAFFSGISLDPARHRASCQLRWRSERGNGRNEGRGRKWKRRIETKRKNERKKERSGGTDTVSNETSERPSLSWLGGGRKGGGGAQERGGRAVNSFHAACNYSRRHLNVFYLTGERANVRNALSFLLRRALFSFPSFPLSPSPTFVLLRILVNYTPTLRREIRTSRRDSRRGEREEYRFSG